MFAVVIPGSRFSKCIIFLTGILQECVVIINEKVTPRSREIKAKKKHTLKIGPMDYYKVILFQSDQHLPRYERGFTSKEANAWL